MECRRWKSRHAAHVFTTDPESEPIKHRGRGHNRLKAIQEGVAKWKFPARQPTKFLPPPPTWQRPQSWTMQMQQSMPEMEGVVSEDLRLRIEKILSFPVGGQLGGEEESAVESVMSNEQAEDRSPAGGLLQDYLDQLDPEEEEEEEDELMFQGSESEESNADLLFDPEKEIYTTPYLVFLQQSRSGRKDPVQVPHEDDEDTETLKDDDDDAEGREEEEAEEEENSGREGARGRNDYRSSIATTERTLTDSKDLPTPLSDKNAGPSSQGLCLPQGTDLAVRGNLKLSGGAQDNDYEEEDEVDEENAENDDLESGASGEEDEDEEREGGVSPSGKKKTKKKSKKKKKKKSRRKKSSSKRSGHGEVIIEEDEEEIKRAKMVDLKESKALSLYRDFIKTVYMKKHPDFQLFGSFEEQEPLKEAGVTKLTEEF